MMAILLRQVWSLIVMMTFGRLPPPSASTGPFGNFQPLHGFGGFDVGSKSHRVPTSICHISPFVIVVCMTNVSLTL